LPVAGPVLTPLPFASVPGGFGEDLSRDMSGKGLQRHDNH
jgi:hypothetical protein